MTGVLVVEDGCSPYVLAAVRSLGRAGFRVGLASPAPNPRVQGSRWAHRWHEVPLPERGLDAFVAGVGQAVREGGYALVFGADDVETLALSATRDRLPAPVPIAPHAAVLRSVDKLSLTEAALSVGVAAPATVEATAAELDRVQLPVVVKSRLHWTPGSGADAGRHLLVQMCSEPEDVRVRVQEMRAAGGSALLQQPVEGEQIAVSVVVDRQGRLAAVSQQRTLMASLARTSVRAETVPVEPELVDGVHRLLTELGWVGLANLQFLRPPGGAPHLIDLNGRFYGSLALAIAAGADLPAVWARTALGRCVGQPQVARPGVRFHSLQADLLRARVQRRGGLRADLLSTARFAPGATHATFALRDPVPAGQLALGLAHGAARGAARRVAARLLPAQRTASSQVTPRVSA